MSVITVQIGQCGNQIGDKLFETIISDCYECSYFQSKDKGFFGAPSNNEAKKINDNYINNSINRFFTSNEHTGAKKSGESALCARSILIDMESKVVNKLIYNDSKTKWVFRDENSYTQKKGSGNNWSYGYCINGPKSVDKIEEIIRKETERTDRLDCFFVCMSMAGGTGSGVGSFYTEFIRENYPRTTIINNCVWPFSTGEVTLQNYNFLLTLSKLYEFSDGLILLENDILHQICKRIGVGGANKRQPNKEITFDDLNSVIAHKLASIVQPCTDSFSNTNHMNDIIGDLCSNNDYKLLSLNNVPQMSKESIEYSSFQWPGLYKNARQLLFTGGFMEEGLNWNNNEQTNKTLAMSLFSRAFNSTFEEQQDLINNHFDTNYLNKFFSTGLFGSLIERPIKLWHSRRSFNNYEKSLSLLSNSQLPAFKIDNLVTKAWSMFSSKAYIHQYVKYGGFEEENLLNSFIFAEQLIKNYKKI